MQIFTPYAARLQPRCFEAQSFFLVQSLASTKCKPTNTERPTLLSRYGPQGTPEQRPGKRTQCEVETHVRYTSETRFDGSMQASIGSLDERRRTCPAYHSSRHVQAIPGGSLHSSSFLLASNANVMSYICAPSPPTNPPPPTLKKAPTSDTITHILPALQHRSNPSGFRPRVNFYSHWISLSCWAGLLQYIYDHKF